MIASKNNFNGFLLKGSLSRSASLLGRSSHRAVHTGGSFSRRDKRLLSSLFTQANSRLFSQQVKKKVR
jgi:hypothetical protein